LTFITVVASEAKQPDPAGDPPDNSQLTIINLNIEVLKERIKNLENWAGGFKS